MTNPFAPGLRYLTDSGLETTLVFHDGRALPAFAAYVLLEAGEGQQRLAAYYRQHVALALVHGLGFVFETPTRRASADWGTRLGHDRATLECMNRKAVALARWLTREYPEVPSVVSGQIGPRQDGGASGRTTAVEEAARYHAAQVRALAGADIVTAMTMPSAAEAAGIARAAALAGIPVVVSFAVESGGRLPSGQPLGEAIEEVDALTGSAPLHYMIDCAHPDHFAPALDGPLAARIGGLRANASRLSRAEIYAASELDAGDPHDLGRTYADLAGARPSLVVFGGCCGTDARHVGCIAAGIAPPPSPVACGVERAA